MPSSKSIGQRMGHRASQPARFQGRGCREALWPFWGDTPLCSLSAMRRLVASQERLQAVSTQLQPFSKPAKLLPQRLRMNTAEMNLPR